RILYDRPRRRAFTGISFSAYGAVPGALAASLVAIAHLDVRFRHLVVSGSAGPHAALADADGLTFSTRKGRDGTCLPGRPDASAAARLEQASPATVHNAWRHALGDI